VIRTIFAIRRRMRGLGIRLLALAAAALILAATFVPTNGGGHGGYPYAIFDTSVQREYQLFAAEPVAVAFLAAATALLLLGRMASFAAGVLLAFGAQSFVLFLAHVGAATFGNPQYNSFRPGGLLGAVGALLLLVAGSLAFLSIARARG
jgi:hypothetical protein